MRHAMGFTELPSLVLLKTMICYAFLFTIPVIAEANASAVDEIVAHLDGQYARSFVLSDGRVVMQTGSVVHSNDPDVFVVSETLGFVASNGTSSLSVVVKGKDKVLDVDDQYLGTLAGTKDVSVIRLSGSGAKSVVEIEGDVAVERLGDEAVRIVVSNPETASTFSFSLSTSNLVFDDVSGAAPPGGSFCCASQCAGGDCQTGTNCILCTCFCGLFGEPWCICWIFNIFGNVTV